MVEAQEEEKLKNALSSSSMSAPEPIASTAPLQEKGNAEAASALNVLEELATTYQRALEKRQISYMARYSSIRQTAIFSVAFMICFLVCGSAFFVATVEDVTIADTLLIAMYTLTSAGFGSIEVPKTDAFLVAYTFYIFVAISALAILVAQTFQYLALESRRFKHRAEKLEGAQVGVEYLERLKREEGERDEEASTAVDRFVRDELLSSLQQFKSDKSFKPRLLSVRKFARTELGRAVLTFSTLAALLLVGTVGMMILEGWDFMDAFYFSVFAMTTVGYGNLKPSYEGSTWFVVIWLPTNVLFLALYLVSVAHYWVMFCNFNRARVERNLRKELDLPEAPPPTHIGKMALDGSVKQGNNNDNGNKMTTATSALPKDEEEVVVPAAAAPAVPRGRRTKQQSIRDGLNRREQLVSLRSGHPFFTATDDDTKIQKVYTMESLLQSLHEKLQQGEVFDKSEKVNSLLFGDDNDEDSLFSLELNYVAKQTSNTTRDVPLALRILVEERLARIIALEIVGSDFHAELKDGETLEVTLEILKEVGDKWLIPGAARTAYRHVAFCTLFYAGEHDLLKFGVQAFFDMNPVQFNSLLSPFVVAMREAKIMEGWLAATEALAKESFFQKQKAFAGQTAGDLALAAIREDDEDPAQRPLYGPRCIVKEEIDDYFPVNLGNATLVTQTS